MTDTQHPTPHAEGRERALVEALRLARATIIKHHSASYRIDWGNVCPVCAPDPATDANGVFTIIDAALAAPPAAPEVSAEEEPPFHTVTTIDSLVRFSVAGCEPDGFTWYGTAAEARWLARALIAAAAALAEGGQS